MPASAPLCRRRHSAGSVRQLLERTLSPITDSLVSIGIARSFGISATVLFSQRPAIVLAVVAATMAIFGIRGRVRKLRASSSATQLAEAPSDTAKGSAGASATAIRRREPSVPAFELSQSSDNANTAQPPHFWQRQTLYTSHEGRREHPLSTELFRITKQDDQSRHTTRRAKINATGFGPWRSRG